MSSTLPLVTRLAPSPTGAQHLGNARTYLVAWLLARQGGGRVVLRVEDIDSPRVKPGAAEQALADLRWLGLDWDAGPVVQTERLSLYEAALDQLKARELVYPCTCTRSDVEQAASAPHRPASGYPDGADVVYPGTCSHRSVADAAALAGRPFAWRFRAADVPAYDDLFRGPVQLGRDDIGGDFVVWKSQGTPAYQLAVVVDDADNGVTVVIRGDDLVSSTPRQLLLYRALGLTPPAFAHVPLVVGPDGRRLAKRHGDTRLSSLRAAGVRAEQIVGLLAWSCGWQPEPTPLAAADLVPRFQLAAIPPRPFVVTPE
ncbi:MAG TPA: tRNA glutamyl-Q(34) synthetase GluQRS, partial [Gemmataceae bacterium]